MASNKGNTGAFWTRERAALLAVLCLFAGMGGGWLVRGAQGPAKALNTAPPVAAAPAANPAPNPDRLKAAADAQAAPLLERLKGDANNAELLTNLGNIYYDAQEYQTAVDYYQRALKIEPMAASVRTDMATAYWYLGNADMALSEFDKALRAAPDSPNALYNRGLVKWQGKKDAAGALADWQKLLATSPNYEARGKVEQMMAEVQQAGAKTGR